MTDQVVHSDLGAAEPFSGRRGFMHGWYPPVIACSFSICDIDECMGPIQLSSWTHCVTDSGVDWDLANSSVRKLPMKRSHYLFRDVRLP